MTISFTIAARPIPKGRPRFSRGRCFTPKRTADFEKTVQAAFAAQCGGAEPLTGSLAVSLSFAFQRPRKTALLAPRPDIDNLTKSVLDSLNGMAYADDSQVVRMTASKSWAASDSIVVSIDSTQTEACPAPAKEADKPSKRVRIHGKGHSSLF